MKQRVICIDGSVPIPMKSIPTDEVFEVEAVRPHPVFWGVQLVYLKDGPERGIGYLPRRFRLVDR